MDKAERERRTREWTEVIDRGLREEQSTRTYRQDPRTGSAGWKNRKLPITEYGQRTRCITSESRK
jgi:hypothetical protein